MDELSNVKRRWVYQSNEFIEASFYLTTNEQKVLRLLASMIKKEDKEFREYQFAVLELAPLIGISLKNEYRELEKVAAMLMTRFIKIKSKTDKRKWSFYHVIKTAKCVNGILTLQIDEEMKDFYLSFQMYTKYQLENVMRFKGTHTFRIYELLKQYEKLGKRSLTIEQIREILDIGTNEYKSYGHLNDRIIKPAVEEINVNTDILVKVESIKGIKKKVIGLDFMITSKNGEDDIQKKETAETIYKDSTSEAQEVNITFKLLYGAELSENPTTEMITIKGFEHVKKCLRDYKDYLEGREIRNIAGDFYTFVMSGYEKPISRSFKIKQSHENFDQREYPDDELEKYYVDVNYTEEIKVQSIEENPEQPELSITKHSELILSNQSTETKCDKCAKKLVEKEGKHGKFLGCPNWKKCGHKPLSVNNKSK